MRTEVRIAASDQLQVSVQDTMRVEIACSDDLGGEVIVRAEEGQRGLATFSIGFDSGAGQEGDEFKYSDLVAETFETEHTRWRVGPDEQIRAVVYGRTTTEGQRA